MPVHRSYPTRDIGSWTVHDLQLSYTFNVLDGLRWSLGVDNLFDREYRDHLNGYNRAANPDISRGERLPGYGINAFARAIYEF